MAVKKTESSLYLNTFSFFFRLGLSLCSSSFLYVPLYSPHFFRLYFYFYFHLTATCGYPSAVLTFHSFSPVPQKEKKKLSTDLPILSAPQSTSQQSINVCPVQSNSAHIRPDSWNIYTWTFAGELMDCGNQKKRQTIESREFFYSSSIITEYIVFGTYIGRWTFFPLFTWGHGCFA